MKLILNNNTQVEFTNYAELSAFLKEEHTSAEFVINSEDMECFKLLMSALPSTKIKSFNIDCSYSLKDIDTAIILTATLQSQVKSLVFEGITLRERSEAALLNFLPASKLKSFSIYQYTGGHVDIRDAQTMAILRALPRELEHLDLRFENIGNLAATALAEILPSSDLKTLIFGGHSDYDCILTQERIQALIAAIASSKLANLQLSNITGFEDKNIWLLAQNLPISQLVTLEFSYCHGIEGVGALALLNTLQNSKVKDLDLNNNNIGSEIADFFNNMQRPLELRKLDLSDNPIGDKGVLALAKASKFLHIDHLDITQDNLGDGLMSYEAQAVLLTALKDNYAIEKLESDNFRDCDYSDSNSVLNRNTNYNDLNSVLNRNINLKLLAKKFNNNEYLSADEIQPLLKVIADVSIDVAYIKKARERMHIATEFLGNNPTKLRATLPFTPTELYKGYLDLICDGGSDSLALTVTNLYFKNSIKISDKNIAAKIFDLLLNSGELKPALKNPHTALFIADKLNDQGDRRPNAEKIDTVIMNLTKIQLNTNAVEFFKAHPSKIGGFLVMPTEKLEGIIKSVFKSKHVYKALSAEPDLLFRKYGIRTLIAETKIKELEEDRTTGNKRCFVRDIEEGSSKKTARSI